LRQSGCLVLGFVCWFRVNTDEFFGLQIEICDPDFFIHYSEVGRSIPHSGCRLLCPKFEETLTWSFEDKLMSNRSAEESTMIGFTGFQLDRGIYAFTSLQRHSVAEIAAGALQLASHGESILIVQFLRGGIAQGPKNPTELVGCLKWMRPNIRRIINSPASPEEHIAIQELWQYIEASLDQFDFIVLDEVGLAIALNLLSEEQLLKFLQTKPKSLGVLLSGTDIPAALEPLVNYWTTVRTIPQVIDIAA
jgi:cob(I)alamin adenosyltransferase